MPGRTEVIHAVRRSLLACTLLLSAAGCTPPAAAGGGAEASAGAEAESGVALLNRDEALRAMDRSYDPLMRDAGVTGTVVVDLALQADGTVRAARVVRSTHERFSASAQEAARVLRFAPPSRAGAAVRVQMQFIHRRGEITVLVVQ
jgi:TonB family protein